MKLTNEVYLVGAGDLSICMTSPSDCAIFLINGGDGHLALIDSGCGADTKAILCNVESDGFNPKDIEVVFLTHAHTDHIGGAKDFRDSLGCQIAISVQEAAAVEDANEDVLGIKVAKAAGFYPKDFVVRSCPVDIRINDGQVFSVGQLKLQAIITPGHSRAHVCYLLQGREKRYFFAGDHISYGGLISLQNFVNSGSSIEGYRESAPKLANLNVDAFLPSHTMFTLNRGQKQIDLMVAACKDLMFAGRYYHPAGVT
jgi:glyoxylase-like metal-dependent hydrolase (beta-lactamase superfamily II)